MAKSCGRLCAIAKPRVAAVLTADEFVRLAYLPRPLSGIGQYSGHAILIADMGQLLGLKRRSEHIVKFWIVVSERDRQVVLQIDDVFGFEPLGRWRSPESTDCWLAALHHPTRKPVTSSMYLRFWTACSLLQTGRTRLTKV